MSRKMLLGCALAALAASGLSAYLALPKPAEGLVARESLRDFGRLSQGDVVSAEFQLVNNCAKGIKIVNVVETCDCAATELSKRFLAAGEEATLKVKWKIGSRRGHSGVEIPVVYRRGEDEQPVERLELRLEADVEPDYHYTPASLKFTSGRKELQSVTLLPGRLTDVSLRRAFCSHRAFEVRCDPGSRLVEVTFDPKQWPSERTMVELTVETNSRHEPSCTIPITVD